MDENDDDYKARCMRYIAERAANGDMSLNAAFGNSQDPVIFFYGETVTELLMIKHTFNAAVSEKPEGGRWTGPHRAVARVRRWEVVRFTKMFRHLFRDNVEIANRASDIMKWAVEHWSDEDNPNRSNPKPRGYR